MYRCRFVQVVAQQIGGLGFEVHAVYALLSLSVSLTAKVLQIVM